MSASLVLTRASFFWCLGVGNLLIGMLVIALVASAAYQSQVHYQGRAEAAAENSAAMLGRQLTGLVERADVSLRTIASEVERHYARGNLSATMLDRLIAGQQALQLDIANLYTTDAAGIIRYGSDPESHVGISVADREYFIRLRSTVDAGLVLGGPLMSRTSNTWGVVLARRLNRPDGSFAGIVAANISVEHFRRIISSPQLGEHGGALLETEDFRVIARFPDVSMAGSKVLSDPIQRLMRAAPLHGLYVSRNGLGQIEQTVVYRRLPPHSLYIRVGLSPEDYLSDWRDDVRQLGMIGGFAMLVSLVASLFLYLGWKRQKEAVEALIEQEQAVRRLATYNRNLIEASLDPLVTIGPDGRITDANTAAELMTGRTRQSLVGTDFSSCFVDPARARAGYQRVFQEGAIRDYPLEVMGPDGTAAIPVLYNASIYRNELGEVLGACAAARDISALKEAERAREKVARALRLLTECNDVLLHADEEQRLLSDICRLTVETGGYLMAWVGFAEQDQDKTVRPVACSGYEDGYLDTGRVSWADTELGQGPTGTATRTGRTCINPDSLANPAMAPWKQAILQRGYRASIGLPLVGENGAFGALTLYALEANPFSAEEVVLLEKLADNLAFGIESLRARIRLAKTNRELQGFTYAASHDIKAPLGRVMVFSKLLEQRYRKQLRGDGLMFLDFIGQNASRLSVLVEDLLAHAQVEQQAANLQKINIQAAVQTAIEEHGDAIAQSGARVHLDLPPALIKANSFSISQVMRNLLGNAIKYSRLSTPPVIEIGGELLNGRYRLWVKDNGIGFDMAYHEKIFEIFSRLHTYDEYPGSGVGLALVRKAMESMGGRVWAASVPSRGTCFYLELKAAMEPPPGQVQLEETSTTVCPA